MINMVNIVAEYIKTIEYHTKRRELKRLAELAGVSYATLAKSKKNVLLETAQKVMLASRKMVEEQKRKDKKIIDKYKQLGLLDTEKKQ